MRGNDWFPFYFDRVRKSKWWRRASDTARARNVMLWGEAYKAVPAGSLPDDDDELAEAAGYGMDVDAFLAVKDEIMSAWVLCSDGRWYHPTICEVVLDAWERVSERRRNDARRKRDQRDRARGVTPETPDVTRDADDVPSYASRNGRDTDTQDRTGQTPPNPPDGGADEDKAFEEAFTAYPLAGRRQTPPAAGRLAWDAERAAGASATVLQASARAMAAKPPARVPRFDNWLRRGLWRNYTPAEAIAPAAPWNGPPELRTAVAVRMGDTWTRCWLEQAHFQEVPARALMVPRALVRDRIAREVGDILDEFRVQMLVQESAA